MEAALTPLLPSEQEPELEPENHTVPVQTQLSTEVQGEAVPRTADLDLGIAVSRDELSDDNDDDDLRPSTEPLMSSSPKVTLTRKRHDVDSTKDKKRKKPIAGEENSTNPESLGELKKRKTKRIAGANSLSKGAEADMPLESEGNELRIPDKKSKARGEGPSKEELPPKKKKKKKGGDEFDDLFSSLL